jgi:hypothetical protein
MELSEQDVEEFRRTWQKEFWEVITREKALLEARKLLELYVLLAKPVPGKRKQPAR